MKPSRSGFTIVELLIVIVIIAILATISIVAYNGVQKRANDSSAIAKAQQAAKKIAVYQIDQGTYPATLGDAGLTSDGLEYTVNNSSSPATYCVTATSSTSSFYVSSTQSSPTSGGCAGHGVGGVAAITNIAPNPGAEAVGGWSSNNGAIYPAIRDTTVKRSGSQSVEGHNVGSATVLVSLYAMGALNGNGFPVQENTTYHISSYFRSGVPHQARLQCSFRLADTSYTGLIYGSYADGTVNQWTRNSVSCTSPAGATMLRVSTQLNALTTQPAGTSGYIDDLMIVEGSTQYNYADGSSPSWVWNGTANQSTSTGPAS